MAWGAAVAVAAALAAATAGGATAAKAKAPPPRYQAATGWAAKVEQAALKVFPPEKLEAVAAFFGPVTKKYRPRFDAFQLEWMRAKEKLPVVAKYMPEAEAALAAAKAMKVPPKYEQQKADYIKTAQALLVMTKMTLALAEAMKD